MSHETEMPLTRIVCPHCDERVEVQLASVTRSRICPVCGESFIIQVSDGARKFKALLMDREVSEPEPKPGSAGGESVIGLPYEPQSLAGEAFDRMRMDPELGRLRLRFLQGLAVVVVVGIALVGLDRLAKEDELPELAAPAAVLNQPMVEQPRQPTAVTGEAVSEPVQTAAVEDPAFKALFEERPKHPVQLRVWAKPGQHYDGLFADAGWVRCIELRAAADPDGPVLHAYVERKTVEGGAMDFRLRQRGDEAQRWTVRVKYPPFAETANQVWLDEVVSEDWEAKRPE
jgi:hypothetical protein